MERTFWSGNVKLRLGISHILSISYFCIEFYLLRQFKTYNVISKRVLCRAGKQRRVLRHPLQTKKEGHPFGCPSFLVREAGLEPARAYCTLEPESSESANSTTRAYGRASFSARFIIPRAPHIVNTFFALFSYFVILFQK